MVSAIVKFGYKLAVIINFKYYYSHTTVCAVKPLNVGL